MSVSGHRNIHKNSLKKIKEQLRHEMKVFAKSVGYENIELVTGLAEGADTIATQIALQENIGVRIVLPAPLEIYKADFKGHALTEFENIVNLGKRKKNITIQEIPLPANISTEDISDHEARKIIYVRLMDYLVRRSNIIFVLWDGKFTGAKGGTSEVVRNYLNVPLRENEGARKIYRFTNNKDSNPSSNIVVWFPCRREGQREIKEQKTQYLFSEGFSDKIWRTAKLPGIVLERTNHFKKLLEKVSIVNQTSLHSLLSKRQERKREDLRIIDHLYGLSNETAIHFQKFSDKSFLMLSLLGGSTGFIYLVYAEILKVKLLLALYVGIILLSFIYFRSTQKSGVFGIHLTARNIAELLRLRFFSRLSGVDANPNFQFLKLVENFRFSNFSTSRAILDFVRCSEPLVLDASKNPRISFSKVRERWLLDQFNYFSSKEKKLSEKIKKISFLKIFLLPCSILQAILLFFFSDVLKSIPILGLNLQSFCLFLMGVFPLMLAIWELYENKKASGELKWQYYGQKKFFNNGLQQFDEAQSVEAKEKILSSIISQSMLELYQWMLHRYHREHDPPTGK